MATAGTVLAPSSSMILKGPDAYFKVPAVTTVGASNESDGGLPGRKVGAGLPVSKECSRRSLRAALKDLFGTLESEGRDRRPVPQRPAPGRPSPQQPVPQRPGSPSPRVSPVGPAAPAEPIRTPEPSRPPFPTENGFAGLDRRAFEIYGAIEAAFPSDGAPAPSRVDPEEIAAILEAIFPTSKPAARAARRGETGLRKEPVFEIPYDFELRCLRKARVREADWIPIGLIQPLDRMAART